MLISPFLFWYYFRLLVGIECKCFFHEKKIFLILQMDPRFIDIKTRNEMNAKMAAEPPKQFLARNLRELGSAYVSAKATYVTVTNVPEKRATLLINRSGLTNRTYRHHWSVQKLIEKYHAYLERSRAGLIPTFEIWAMDHNVVPPDDELAYFVRPDPTRLRISAPSLPNLRYTFYQETAARFRRHLRIPLGRTTKEAPLNLDEYFNHSQSLAPPFDPTLPIMIPNPILPAARPVNMYNTGDLSKIPSNILPGIPNLGDSGEYGKATWLFPRKVFGEYFDDIINEIDTFGLMKHEIFTEEQYDQKLDAFARNKMPLEKYVEGLVKQTRMDLTFIQGFVRTLKWPYDLPYFTPSDPQYPTPQDRTLVLYLAYLSALVSAKRTIMLIKAAFTKTDVSAYYVDASDRLRNTYKYNKVVDYLISSSLLVSPEDSDTIRAALQGSLRSVDESDKKLRALKELVNEGKMHPNTRLAYDHPFDFPMPDADDVVPEDTEDDDTEDTTGNPRASRSKLVYIVLEMLMSRLDNLVKLIDDRLNTPFQQHLILSVSEHEMRFMNDALVNVWPSEDGMFIFNPLPPIVENILVPHSFFISNNSNDDDH